MTASSQADAGVFTSARLSRAVARTAITAVLAVVFGLSVMVEVSNAPEAPSSADAPVVPAQAASTVMAGLSGAPQAEGAAAAS
jgi:hypothetical protein